MKPIFAALAISVFIAGLFPAYNSALANETAAALVEKDIEYTPEAQTVRVGQTIRLVNKDPFEHKSRVTLQKEDGTLGEIALKDHVDKPGTDYTFTLNKPGIYEIRCMLHDGMTATISVVK